MFYLLERSKKDQSNAYDEAVLYVVRALSKEEARELCAAERDDARWMNPSFARCKAVPSKGESAVILEYFKEG